jgi:Tetratricopeptide repeat
MSQALQLLEQVRSQYTAVIGAEHRTTLATSLNLANAYHSIGRLTDAARLLRDPVERCERSLPDSGSPTIAARGPGGHDRLGIGASGALPSTVSALTGPASYQPCQIREG